MKKSVLAKNGGVGLGWIGLSWDLIVHAVKGLQSSQGIGEQLTSHSDEGELYRPATRPTALYIQPG